MTQCAVKARSTSSSQQSCGLLCSYDVQFSMSNPVSRSVSCLKPACRKALGLSGVDGFFILPRCFRPCQASFSPFSRRRFPLHERISETCQLVRNDGLHRLTQVQGTCQHITCKKGTGLRVPSNPQHLTLRCEPSGSCHTLVREQHSLFTLVGPGQTQPRTHPPAPATPLTSGSRPDPAAPTVPEPSASPVTSSFPSASSAAVVSITT